MSPRDPRLGKPSSERKPRKAAATKTAKAARTAPPKSTARGAADAGATKARAKRAPASAPAAAEAVAVEAIALPPAPVELPFERFAVQYLTARGGTVRKLAPLEYEAEFDAALARVLRRSSARLVFDTERANLPRGGVFVAPGSRFGLLLSELARGKGQVTRGHLENAPDADAQALARPGFPLHGATLVGTKLGEPRWVAQFAFHFTLTLRGGMAEQDARAVLADPRGPHFEFLEGDEMRSRRVEAGFPDAPVWWNDSDVRMQTPGESAQSLWTDMVAWLNRVQEGRLSRWRRRCDESRDRDLARVNDFYQTRIDEERDRRRRRRDLDEEDQATEAELKLEWGRRVKAIRARWEPSVELRLWGIEEIARPRVPATWTYKSPKGTVALDGEVDLGDAALTRLPCPRCGRLVGEFWWEGGEAVCRRCRGRGGRLAVVSSHANPAGGERAQRSGRGGGVERGEPSPSRRGVVRPAPLPRSRTAR